MSNLAYDTIVKIAIRLAEKEKKKTNILKHKEEENEQSTSNIQ